MTDGNNTCLYLSYSMRIKCPIYCNRNQAACKLSLFTLCGEKTECEINVVGIICYSLFSESHNAYLHNLICTVAKSKNYWHSKKSIVRFVFVRKCQHYVKDFVVLKCLVLKKLPSLYCGVGRLKHIS